MITRWGEVNTNNSCEMEVIYSAYKVEQINDYLFIDTYKSNKIKIRMNEMRVNDSETSIR